MFSAIDRGKAGHWFEEPGRPWRSAIRIEDSLTALVFDVLQTVPGRTLGRIIEAVARPRDGYPSGYDAGWLTDDDYGVMFWPRIDGLVEPDLLIVSEAQKRALIVESKLGQAHSDPQLRSELTAVAQEYPEYLLEMLAFGDDHYAATQAVGRDRGVGARVFGATWRELARTVAALSQSPIPGHERRALSLLRAGLNFFGYRRFEGFEIEFPERLIIEAPDFDKFTIRMRTSDRASFDDLRRVSVSELDRAALPAWRNA